jgi:hypothetical protein
LDRPFFYAGRAKGNRARVAQSFAILRYFEAREWGRQEIDPASGGIPAAYP